MRAWSGEGRLTLGAYASFPAGWRVLDLRMFRRGAGHQIALLHSEGKRMKEFFFKVMLAMIIFFLLVLITRLLNIQF